MKRLKTYIIALLTLAVAFSSCTDDALISFITATPTELDEEYAYLADYDVLRTYVDRSVNPNFKLGSGVDFSTNEGINYMMAATNFDEVTPGNLMKYGSCVSSDGSTDYTKVTSFVNACKTGGLTTYGHTLCWHSQQQVGYLTDLLADEVIESDGSDGELMEVEQLVNGSFEGSDFSTSFLTSNMSWEYTADGEGYNGEGRALKMTNDEVRSEDYEAQLIIQFDPATVEGDVYIFSVNIKASTPCSVTTQAQSTPYNYKYWNMFGNLEFTTEWTTFQCELTIDDNRAGCKAVAFNMGLTAGDFYFDNMSLVKREYVVTEEYKWEELIPHGDMESGETNDEFMANGAATLNFIPNAGPEGDQCVMITNPAVQAETYGAQFIFQFSPAAEVGDEYEFSIDLKADVDCTFGTQAQSSPGNYLHWNMFGDITCTTEWTTYTKSLTISSDLAGLGAVAFDLGATATNFYFDNLSFKKKVPANVVEKTDEEKKVIIEAELERWIDGMMKACDGYVTSWDVVNEPLSGTDTDGDGYYDPWDDSTGDPSSNFYWCQYLGPLDFVRFSVQFARQYFAEYEGDPSKLKLFINDYNLESDWDDNKKMKSMLHWVQEWEADGTVIDGLGTQMHVTYYANPTTQASKEEHIVDMLELLASSGKLVKISELDMGYQDADGNDVMYSDITEEQHHEMAAFYKFIVQKYFEIIPTAQRYGITHWTATDSATNSSWRAGTPCGLWDVDYNRKHTYAGFADGLKEYSGVSK